jgi:hypothetical protein
MDIGKKKVLMVSGGVVGVLAVLSIWVYRPPTTYDPEKVHPRLSAVGDSFSFSTSLYQDGGSLAIVLKGDRGYSLRCFVPGSMGESAPYTRLLLGWPGQKLDEYEEVAEPEHSLLMLQALLHRHREIDPFSADMALSVLRGRVRDYASLMLHKIFGSPQPLTLAPAP